MRARRTVDGAAATTPAAAGGVALKPQKIRLKICRGLISKRPIFFERFQDDALEPGSAPVGGGDRLRIASKIRPDVGASNGRFPAAIS